MQLIQGDCLEVMATMPDASIDAICGIIEVDEVWRGAVNTRHMSTYGEVDTMSKYTTRTCPVCNTLYEADMVRLKHGRQTTCCRVCSYKLRGSQNPGPVSKSHREAISRACKGRKSWARGKKMPIGSLYKNMQTHLRFDVPLAFLRKFDDIEKLKTLNRCITNRSGRFDESDDWYRSYIERFYNDPVFDAIYRKWVESGKDPYLKPSIDHIIPRTKGGDNTISNLQFLTWFENRCKNNMTQPEWEHVKVNIGDYFV